MGEMRMDLPYHTINGFLIIVWTEIRVERKGES